MTPVSPQNGAFYNCDCITGAREHLPDNSVDLIITDPPYGINGDQLHKHYNRNEEFVIGGYVEIPQQEYAEFSRLWIKEAERVLRPGGSLYIVSGYTNLIDILNALRTTGLKEINHVIWKYNFGVYTHQKYVSSHYHILFYEKPGGKRTFNLECRYGLDEKNEEKRSLNNIDREDVWIINREYKPGQLKNKNELPTKLLVKIIQYSSNEGELVCDFFLGGFSTAKVALGLNRRATGFEISRQMFNVKIKEIAAINPGDLIQGLRSPTISTLENPGKPWTDEEIHRLKLGFLLRDAKGMTKKDIVAELGAEHGRGHFAIVNALKKIHCTDQVKPARTTRKDFSWK